MLNIFKQKQCQSKYVMLNLFDCFCRSLSSCKMSGFPQHRVIERPRDPEINPGRSVWGFTLAEVLITLGVVGVVASIVIPPLTKNMTDKVFTEAKSNSLMKITEATKMMKSNDVLSGYTTNDEFINVFQKYMKVTAKCDSSNLAKCFPAKFKTGMGQEVDTTSLSTGTQLGDNNLNQNTVALMLANGTSMLFTLRDSTKVGTSCDRIKPYDNKADTTGCMSFLYDINGYKGPNVMGKDIGSVNATISTCDGTKISGLCVDIINTAYTAKSEAPYMVNNNNWAGARDACIDRGLRLPTKAELTILNDNRVVLGLVPPVNNYWYYWSSEETSSGANSAWILSQDSGSGIVGTMNKQGLIYARCVK